MNCWTLVTQERWEVNLILQVESYCHFLHQEKLCEWDRFKLIYYNLFHKIILNILYTFSQWRLNVCFIIARTKFYFQNYQKKSHPTSGLLREEIFGGYISQLPQSKSSDESIILCIEVQYEGQNLKIFRRFQKRWQ